MPGTSECEASEKDRNKRHDGLDDKQRSERQNDVSRVNRLNVAFAPIGVTGNPKSSWMSLPLVEAAPQSFSLLNHIQLVPSSGAIDLGEGIMKGKYCKRHDIGKPSPRYPCSQSVVMTTAHRSSIADRISYSKVHGIFPFLPLSKTKTDVRCAKEAECHIFMSCGHVDMVEDTGAVPRRRMRGFISSQKRGDIDRPEYPVPSNGGRQRRGMASPGRGHHRIGRINSVVGPGCSGVQALRE